jgi:chromate reductase, NAD(P)H dehydrogenase (quinone)
MRILAVAGSLRRDSHNRRLLRAATALLPPEVEVVEFDGLKAIPPFDEDDEPSPGPAVDAWREAIASADGLLVATPEYNSSIPGQLKNAVDWASRPFSDTVLRNKPAAVIGASTSMFGAVWAQGELRKSLAAAGARVIDLELPVPSAAEAFNDDGSLAEREQEEQLRGILVELRDAAERHAAAQAQAREAASAAPTS